MRQPLRFLLPFLRFKRATCRYTCYGALFGCLFPIVATLISVYRTYGALTLTAVWAVQSSDPLLWIIDSAPFWLGLFAFEGGRKQDRVTAINQQLKQELQQRKEAEKALRESERRYRALIEDANDAILIADAATRQIVDANKKAQEMVGRSLSELCQLQQSDLFPTAQQAAFEDKFRRHVINGERLEEDLLVLHRSGKRIPVDVSASIVEVNGRQLSQAILRDITAQRRYERKLIEAREHAEEMLQLKTDIIHNLSHEIRTPLASILGFADTLVTELSGHTKEFAGLIQQSAVRLEETLTSMLDLANLEQQSGGPSLESVEVTAVVREAVAQYAERAKRKGLAVTVEAHAAASAYATERDLHRVLSNLLSNAIKFTEEGGVTVTVNEAADAVHIAVCDTGIGMTADFLPHAFEEFRQESRGLRRKHDGSGLGLSIVKRLVEVMNGAIDIESEPEVGTRVVLRLPTPPADAPAVPER